VVLDDGLPDADGLELLRELIAARPESSVIFVVSPGNEARGTDALSHGAYHFVLKPFEPRTIADVIDEARSRASAPSPDVVNANGNGHSRVAQMLVGESEPMRRVRQLLGRIAVSPARAILVSGEQGTGRHLVARVIHEMSTRSGSAFHYLSGGASPDELRRGLEDARDGTLVLDHLASAAPRSQELLQQALRGTDGARIVVVGDPSFTLQVASSDIDEQLARDLGAYRIEMPALRMRREDVRPLAEHFVGILGPALGSRATELSEAAVDRFCSYEWPGNVRELRDRVERALMFCDRETLEARDIGELDGKAGSELEITLPPDGLDLKELERNLVVQALARTKGNRTRAAELLHMTRDQMRYRVAKFGLD